MSSEKSILSQYRIIVIFIILVSAAVVFGQEDSLIIRPGEKPTIIRPQIAKSRLVIVKNPIPGEADMLAVSRVENQLFTGDRNGVFKVMEIPERGNTFPNPDTITMNRDRFPLRQILFLPDTAYVLKGNSIFKPKAYGTWMGYYTKETDKTPVERISDFWSMDFSDSNSACVVGVYLRKDKGKDVVDSGLLICNQDLDRNPKDWKTPLLPAAFQTGKISSQLTGIDFIGKNGWLVGASGIIWRTDDSGREWQEQQSNTKSPLLSVYAVGEENVWATGFGGTILHLGDDRFDRRREQQDPIPDKKEKDKNRQRKDKDSQKTNESNNLPDGVRLPPIGVTATITTDNRRFEDDDDLRWHELENNPVAGQNLRLWSVKFAPNKQNGWIVGDAGTILYTKDGGLNWEKIKLVNDQNRPLFVTPPNFYSIFIDNEYCWIAGSQGVVLRMDYRAGERNY